MSVFCSGGSVVVCWFWMNLRWGSECVGKELASVELLAGG